MCVVSGRLQDQFILPLSRLYFRKIKSNSFGSSSRMKLKLPIRAKEMTPLPLQRITVICAGCLLFITFATGLCHRLKLSNFASFKSLTLTNKYYVVSISSGLFALACLIETNKRWINCGLCVPRNYRGYRHHFSNNYNFNAPHECGDIDLRYRCNRFITSI